MKNLLIIEDLPEVADWLAETVALAFPQSTSVRAQNLAEARSLIAGAELDLVLDLVLIDIGLPDGNGIQLIAEIKQQHPDCFCVMTTIFDDPGHLFPALSAGADGYLLKDDEEPVFIEALKGIVEGRPPLSAAMARMMLEQFRTPSGSGGSSAADSSVVDSSVVDSSLVGSSGTRSDSSSVTLAQPSVTLTPREEQMLVLIGNGYSVRKAAESLGISHHTAAGYLKTLYQKLQVNNRAEATLKAVQFGLLNPGSPD